MRDDLYYPWPLPHPSVARKWPNGFPAEDSEEFRMLVYQWSLFFRVNIAGYLERELSTIDCLEITKHTRDVVREIFMGNCQVDPYGEVSYRYYLNVFGYLPEEVHASIGDDDEVSPLPQILFHRLHARAHHE